jgi:hypothetical protein
VKSASELSVLAFVLALAAAILAGCKSDPRAEPHGEAGQTGQTGRMDDAVRCATCHLAEFDRVDSKSAPHPGVRPTACGACHLETSWKPWRVDHPWWQLTGAHLRTAEDKAAAGKENQVKCFWCHRGDPATWKTTPKECIACHEPDRKKSKFPGHDTFADTCEDCHSTDKWKPTTKVIERPKPPPEPEPLDAGAPAAGAQDAGAKPVKKPPPPKVPPRPPPSTPPKRNPLLPPDVITRPSG